MKKIRCKAKNGVSYSWIIDKNKDGKFRAVSVGKPSNKAPMDFTPFEIMDAVMNRGIIFDTEYEAEDYVRSL
jgi:translation elongation factor EF-1alpha